MIRLAISDNEQELDRFVAKFEAACSGGQEVELATYLPSRDHPLYSSVLCELVRVDLELSFERNRPRRPVEYFALFPELFGDVAARAAVSFEEFRLRRQMGDAVPRDDYQRFYGVDTRTWPELETGTTSAEHVQSAARREVPKPGDCVAGFELVAEIGQGAFAKVFVARQLGLAERLVVLKISRLRVGEPQILARLQHANIVPVYSTHDLGDSQVVCMPYLGRATLATMLTEIRGQGYLPPTGAVLVETLRSCQMSTTRKSVTPIGDGDKSQSADAIAKEPPESANTVSPSGAASRDARGLELIGRLSYVEAVLWITARLGEGLQHAHERGIVHRDLKPANILLADDGQPMILDFNLSHDVVARRDALERRIGGTLAYMSPENLAAYYEDRYDEKNANAARGDIYALGVVLYELLTGESPFTLRSGSEPDVLPAMIEDRRGSAPRPGSVNPAVTPAVDAIVGKCLTPKVGDRYACAADLVDDINRHLANLPLKHVREPSLAERARKWARRHPRLTSLAGTSLTAAAIIVVLATGFMFRGRQLAAYAASEHFRDFQRDFQAAQVELLDAPSAGKSRLRALETSIGHVLDVYHVGDRVDRANWQLASDFQSLSAAQQHEVRADVGELRFLLASLVRLQALGASCEAADTERLRRALELNLQAESDYPADEIPTALFLQRALLQRDLGNRSASAQNFAQAKRGDRQTTRDLGMKASLAMNERRFTAALADWQKACSQDPKSLWAWCGQAICCDQLSRFEQAAGCYTACIAIKPDRNDWYRRRGSIELKQRHYEAAATDFDEALRRGQDSFELRMNRGIARLGLGQTKDAIDDLQTAAQLQRDDARVHLLLAQAWEKLRQPERVTIERSKGLSVPPADEAAWVARAVAEVSTSPATALDDLNRAIAVNGYYLPAWESKAHVQSERLGRTADGVKTLDRAIEIFPENGSLVAARSVLLARLSDYDAARRDAEAALELDASPAVQYQVAGAFAQLSRHSPDDASRAIALLAKALQAGFGRELVNVDPDLNPLRDSPRFKALVQAARLLRESASEVSDWSAVKTQSEPDH